MKKTIIIMAILSAMVYLISCGADDTSTQSESVAAESISNQSVNESQSDDGNSQVDLAYEFATEQEAVNYFFDEETVGNTNNYYADEIQTSSSDGIYVYSPETIPDGFELDHVTGPSTLRYVYSKADAGTDDEEIFVFSWSYSKSDTDSLDDIRELNTLIDISNKPGYYYSSGGENQFIYWCEDGYLFSVIMSSSVGTVNTTTHEYSGEDVFTLQKTFYPFDDNTVAE